MPPKQKTKREDWRAIDLPKWKDELVLVHPASMLLCGLSIGHLCILNDSHVLRAWPNTSLHPVSVVLPKTSILQEEIHFEAGNLVTVQIFKDAGRIAEEVEIEIRFAKVTAQTKFVLSHFKGSISDLTTEKKITFDYIGGLDKQIKAVSYFFHIYLKRSDLLAHYGHRTSQGILLFGPRGTGKTMFAKAIANEMSLFPVYISGDTDVLSKFYGETEKKLKDIFQLAAKRSPSLIIFDELDRLCPPRDNTHSDLKKRIVTTLITLLDELAHKESKVVCYVLGITSKPDSIDPALRRAGRLDYEIETSVPSAAERLQILKAHLHDVPHNISETDLKAVSDAAHGFVGADLTALLKKAKLCAVRRLSQKEGMMHVLTCEDLLLAAKQISPSAMREVQLEVPEVKWEDIGGQAEIKLKLQQAVQWPLQHPESFTRLGISPPRGVLLYGPPGCSKTMIAKALATESGLNFLAVKGPELFTKWVGESERAVREVFRKARAAAPSIIFFDEIDVLAVERGSSGGTSNVADRVLTQLLTEIDGIERLQGVTIVAATNRPDMIDKAFLRPGRIDRILYVPLPDFSTRREILQISVRKMPLAEDVVLDDLAKQTEQYSGAELTAVCNEAALSALQEDINCERVALRHFNIALATVKPGISAEMLHFYENYSKKSGLHFV
ncbi:hypothetical protein C0Q70_06042 [Pomacea canaliculata]|uniref:non-chaperonin molecular chaperone ATPase n=1 Tax=Pomacea canaliculata TaxID=400727 RepID=A0A2T7PMW9_POMCA|nr:hypothetical protein C0Q70_06042 [Pomacea canaliculata]